MACLVCGSKPSDPAHIQSRGAGGDDTDQNVMPLCRRHHTEQGQIGITTFANKYLSVKLYLESKGWYWDEKNKLRKM
jgi:hypothetical protein